MSNEKKTVTVRVNGPEMLKHIYEVVNDTPRRSAYAAAIMHGCDNSTADIKNNQ